jgi:hypothetical protein
MARRRRHLSFVLCGAVVIAAGFGIAVVEALRFPKGSIWALVATTIVLIALIRWLDRRG